MKRVLSVFFILLPILIHAQNQRPVVGVAFSGGGAKGFAHIGVLKIIDSLGIPIDYVAGTSMGSIVGGLYAIGQTPQQIEQHILETNWDDLMNPIPARKYELYSSKDLKKRNLFTLGFKDRKIVVPAGLNSASKVTQKFCDLTVGYHGQQDFMKFPRGFVCIAADINTGQPVIFKEGSLPDAMRASMSIPTMFTPHKYAGHTMIDGGTINNFPTDELEKLGCDIIIGVDLQTTIDDTTNLTMTKILEKSAMFINSKSNKERQELCDILIKPVLTGYGVQSFSDGEPIIRLGEQSARIHLDELVALSNRMSQYDTVVVKKYSFPDTVLIKDLEVNGLQKVSKAFITGTFDVEPNQRYAIKNLQEAERAVYGSEYFEKTSYKIIGDSAEGYVLQINVSENTNDLDIGFGFRHDPDYSTSFLINLAARNVLIKGSRFNADIVASERPRFRLLYEVDKGFKPGFGIRSDLYLLYPKAYDVNDSTYQFIGNYKYDDWTTGIYALASLANQGIIRLGGELNAAYLNVNDVPYLRELLDRDGNNPDATKFTVNNLNLFSEIALDNLDDFDYPTRGHNLFLAARYHNSFLESFDLEFENQFITLYGTYRTAFSAAPKFTIIPELASGWSFINDPIIAYGFNLGGLGRNYFQYQTSFLGYRYLELGLQNFVKGGLQLRVNIFGKHYISALGNYGGTFLVRQVTTYIENGSNNINYVDFTGFGFKYSIDTFLGPIELTAHKNVDNGIGWLFYFNLGYWF